MNSVDHFPHARQWYTLSRPGTGAHSPMTAWQPGQRTRMVPAGAISRSVVWSGWPTSAKVARLPATEAGGRKASRMDWQRVQLNYTFNTPRSTIHHHRLHWPAPQDRLTRPYGGERGYARCPRAMTEPLRPGLARLHATGAIRRTGVGWTRQEIGQPAAGERIKARPRPTPTTAALSTTSASVVSIPLR